MKCSLALSAMASGVLVSRHEPGRATAVISGVNNEGGQQQGLSVVSLCDDNLCGTAKHRRRLV